MKLQFCPQANWFTSFRMKLQEFAFFDMIKGAKIPTPFKTIDNNKANSLVS